MRITLNLIIFVTCIQARLKVKLSLNETETLTHGIKNTARNYIYITQYV